MPLREELSLRERCFRDGCAIEGGGVVKGRKGVIMVSVPSKDEVSSREGCHHRREGCHQGRDDIVGVCCRGRCCCKGC